MGRIGDIQMDDFLLRALAAGLGVALVTGPLGCFVVWRRQAYFGAALAHAALPGVALGILLDLNAAVGVAVVCLLVALLAAALEGQRRLASDTLLGIMAHGALALGLVAVALIEGMRVDLLGYLFGDILAVSWSDVAWIAAGGGLALGLLGLIWRQLLALTVHEELAAVEGVAVARTRLLFMVVMALVIASGMRVVGILLIVSLLIVPAAAARRFAATPEQMALLAAAIGAASVAGGLAVSLAWDTPAGPSMVLVAVAVFAVSHLAPVLRLRR